MQGWVGNPPYGVAVYISGCLKAFIITYSMVRGLPRRDFITARNDISVSDKGVATPTALARNDTFVSGKTANDCLSAMSN